MLSIRELANAITVTRIVCAGFLLFTIPFSLVFWVLYLYCGASDLADGLIARALKQQSDFGAKLDSIADTVFFFSAGIAVIPAFVIPAWIWISAVAIALVRAASYLIGYRKYHVFSALHTYANKATGVFLYVTPVLGMRLGVTATGIMLCGLAAFSAGEELLITGRSKDLDRNRKSIFIR